MKHQTPDLLKFKKLQRRLGVSRLVAIGLLESLWIFTQTNAPRGDIGRFSDEEIAAAIEWSGDHGALVEALAETGWLDKCQDHRLVIHDWHLNAPRYVHGIVSKQGGFVVASRPLQSPTTVAHCTDQQPNQPNLTKPKGAGETPAPPEPCDSSPESPKRHKVRPQAPAEPTPAIPAALASSEPFRAAWDAWLGYRRGRRATCRPETLAKQLDLLASLGPADACVSIESSIRNGWQGLFAPKHQPNGKTKAADSQAASDKALADFAKGSP